MNIILYAAENPARDLVSGGAAQALILNQRLS
jgi:1,6-anhydro-N-acetylmuramate kinase